MVRPGTQFASGTVRTMSDSQQERDHSAGIRTIQDSAARFPQRKARFSTISDVEIERLYTPSDWTGPRAGAGGPTAVDHLGDPLRSRGWHDSDDPEDAPGPWAEFDALRDVGYPGEPPFTRGVHPTGYRARLWTMRMFAGFGAAEDTNRRFKQLLGAGQTGLSIAYDMPTLYGYDTDDPEADGEFGTCGVAVSSLADMEVLLDGLPLDRVSTSMTINSPAAPIWAMYIAAAEKRGFPRAALEGTLQNDILKEYIAQKEFLFPPEPSLRLVTDTIEFGTREMPRWNTITISGYHIREAGSTAVQELAFTIADGMAYVEEGLKRGLRVDEFAPRLCFFFNSHSDFFEEIAKFRAARRIWWKLMTQRYRAENERSTWMRFHTQTAGVSLTAQQPLNNLTRVALQALAAVLGGSQSLHTDAYDEAWAVPSADAALLALRQQQIIAAEIGRDQHDRSARRVLVRGVAHQRGRAAGVALPGRDRSAGRDDRRGRVGLSAERDRRRGVSLSARTGRGRARDHRGQRVRKCGRAGRNPAARGVRGQPAATPLTARAHATRARPRGRGGCLGAAARPGFAPGIQRGQPDAGTDRVRQRLRDPRRDVRRLPHGLRRVPGAGGGMNEQEKDAVKQEAETTQPAKAQGEAAVKKPKTTGIRVTGWAEDAGELASFLEEPNLCRVGTTDLHGYAHITPAWFHWDGAVFYIGADADDAKVANVRRNRTASIEIDSDVRRKRGILARGSASIVAGRAKYEEISIPQVRRYVPNRVPRELAAKMAEKGNPVVIEVRPISIISWGR